MKIKSLILMLSTSLLMTFCFKQKIEEGQNAMVVLASQGDVEVSTLWSRKDNSKIDLTVHKNPTTGFILKGGDIIRTFDGSIDLQGKDKTIIRIKEFSTFKLVSIDKTKNSFALNSGEIFAKIDKANKEITVSTPTSVAAVRGTQFTVIADNNRSHVSTYEGKVLVTNKRNNDQKVLEQKEEVEIFIDSDELNKREFEPEETRTFEFETMISVEDSTFERTVKGDKEELYNEFYRKKEKNLNRLKEESIEINIGRNDREPEFIEQLTLVDGTVIVGIVVSQNNNFMTVKTGGGYMTIDKSEISVVNMIKNTNDEEN